MTTEYEVMRQDNLNGLQDEVLDPAILVNVMPTILMESISENEGSWLLDVTDEGKIIIAQGKLEYFRQMIDEGNEHIDPKILKGLLNFLGENSGKTLANLMGYKALNRNGVGVFDGKNPDNFVGEEIEIGKMLLPDTQEFSLTLSFSTTEKIKANLNFKFFGINGAAHKEYKRTISQTTPLSNVSSRLTVYVVSKIVRFQKENGDYFYWRKIHRLGEAINTTAIQNEYLLVDDGYKQVEELLGNQSPISTIGYSEPRKMSIAINENTCFKIGSDIKEESYIDGSLGLSGELQILKSFQLDYIVPPGGEYMFSQNNHHFENIWAIKT